MRPNTPRGSDAGASADATGPEADRLRKRLADTDDHLAALVEKIELLEWRIANAGQIAADLMAQAKANAEAAVKEPWVIDPEAWKQ